MAVLRSDIEKALAELISNEEGMRFQGLAVILAKLKWPELIACERHNDLGLDAYASAMLSSDGRGKGLACSITPTLKKISSDATRAREHFGDITVLIFATPDKVTNQTAKEWAAEIRKEFDWELIVISREEIITSLMMPSNVALCRTLLALPVEVEETDAELIERVREATSEVIDAWSARLRGKPVVELRAVKLAQDGRDSAEGFRLSDMQAALVESRRIVLEAPAGRGKTTTLIQLAKQHIGIAGTAFLIDLPVWIASRLGILQFIAGMPPFLSRSIDAGALARVYKVEHFSFLLNGWNEIAEANSLQGVEALRELERNFPAAGILVATRTHHIVPPLLGCLRTRLLTLTRAQRTTFLRARLGNQADELRSRLDGDPVLDDLTRTPFILSEVTALFEAGSPIPATKMGVLDAVMRLLEHSDEHSHHLQLPPLSRCASDFLGALATGMTTKGEVNISEEEARPLIHSVAVRLRDTGKIAALPEPLAVLNTLSAHHVLERLSYPTVAFRFEHQQFQELYAAHGTMRELWQLLEKGPGQESHEFTKKYVNEPAWAEPLRVIAEEIGVRTTAVSEDRSSIRVGQLLVEMGLSVDAIFAAELARLCGASVWREVQSAVIGRLQSWYAVDDPHHRHCALAGMLASGSEEFQDFILPIFSSNNQQVRLTSYRTWSELHVSSFGADWRETVQKWAEEARADFVSELLHNRLVPEIISFALADPSLKVREAAISGVIWVGSEEDVTRILAGLDAETFENVVQKQPLALLPVSVRPRALAVYQKLYGDSADTSTRLSILLRFAELGDRNLSDRVKGELAKLAPNEIDHHLGRFVMKPALDIVRKIDPLWVNHWVAERVVEGCLWSEDWMALVTSIPEDVKERALHRIESEDFKHARFDGIISVLAASSDVALAERVFSKLCALHRAIAHDPDSKHEFEWAIERQLETLYKAVPVNIAVAGVSKCFSRDVDLIELNTITSLFSTVGRKTSDLGNDLNGDLRNGFRAYLKKGVALALQADDFSGSLKANLVSVLALVGEPEDMTDLRELIRADIERVRKGRAAWARGDRGKLGNGGAMSYANWHVRAVAQLDSSNADSILIDFLKEPEYELAVALELVCLITPQKTVERFANKVDYQRIWEARAGQLPASCDEQRRKCFAAAITERITSIMDERARTEQKRPYDYRLEELAKALAAIDSHGSAALVLAVMSLPGECNAWRRVEGLETLLFNGARLPTEETVKILERVLEHIRAHLYDNQQVWLLKRVLCLLPFVDAPLTGINKVRQVIAEVKCPPYELRDVVTAVGHSHCDKALDLLRELGSGDVLAKQLGDTWINAVAALATAEAKQLLLSFVDPDVSGLPAAVHFDRDDVLAARIVEMARRDRVIEQRLLQLCDAELPAAKRLLLSKVIGWLGTSEAVSAGLKLIDDNVEPSVPYETWEQLEATFVERRRHGKSENTYMLTPRSAELIRVKLIEMATKDTRRKRSAFSLLGQIEEWRLEYGRPNGEPRHPAFGDGSLWPPIPEAS